MAINTIVEIELADGRIVSLSMNYARLMKLSNKNKRLYDRYNKITHQAEGLNDLDIAEVLYIAYVCGNIDEDEHELIEFDEFLENLPPNREELLEIYTEKLQPRIKPKN